MSDDSQYQLWQREVLEPSLEKMPERKKQFKSGSGQPVKPLYTQGSVSEENIGLPGQPPFTRGIWPTMYRSRLWTMRQYAGFATAAESNRRYRYLLEQGTTGLSVAFDLPTQLGYDSDDAMAHGEVGRVGVAIDTIADMRALFDGIDLGKVSTSMTINATAPLLLALYVAVAEEKGISRDKLRGTVQNDILKEYIARGAYIFPPGPSMRLIGDVISWCASDLPQWNPISISGYHIREAGATAALEVGLTLADAIGYIQAAVDRGQPIDSFAPRLSFFFAVHTDLFEEVAKFRAARRMYARIIRERFGSTLERSQMLRFHAQTGGVTLTSQQPDNNVVRVAIQSLAAVLGGTQSLHANSKDEALALPSEASAKLALRTQQVIAHESGVTNTVDPLGGSYFVEQLTDQIEAQSQQVIDRIDQMGGIVAAVEQGWPQAQIEQAAYAYGQSIENGERTIVGVNQFTESDEGPIELFKIPPELAQQQIDSLQQVKKQRDAAAVEKALAQLKDVARTDANLMPAIVDAARAQASIGEMSNSLREVFGEYRPR